MDKRVDGSFKALSSAFQPVCHVPLVVCHGSSDVNQKYLFLISFPMF